MKKNFRKDINALRAFAIIPVVLFHFKIPYFSGGFLGVDVFFVISGFLMTRIITERILSNSFSLLDYYIDRIFRIVPALALLVATLLVVGWFNFYGLEYKQLGNEAFAAMLFISNILYWRESGYFDPGSDEMFLLHTWSLGVEWQFYILYPLVLLLFFKLFSFKAIKKILFAMFVISFFVALVLAKSYPTATFYSLPTRAWEMLAGGLIFLFPFEIKTERAKDRLQYISVVLIIGSIFFIDDSLSWPAPWALIPVLGSCIFLVAQSQKTYISNNSIFQFLGTSSYSIYLWHWPVYILLNLFGFMSNIYIVICGILVSVLLGYLSYLTIETYFLNIKKANKTKRIKLLAYSFLMFSLAVPGFIIYKNNGIEGEVRAIASDERSELLAYYKDVHLNGLRDAYLLSCDFYDNKTKKSRQGLPDVCTNGTLVNASATKSVFLWGDSHAQALSSGLRSLLPKNYSFNQVATSACTPEIKKPAFSQIDNNCEFANKYALEQIELSKPDIVILAQRQFHENNNWAEISRGLKSIGAKNVVLVGPIPQYKPSLPAIYIRYGWQGDSVYIKKGLESSVVTSDHIMQARYQAGELGNELIYVSLMSELCSENGCEVILDKENRTLLLVDYGHLSIEGSAYIANIILESLQSQNILN